MQIVRATLEKVREMQEGGVVLGKCYSGFHSVVGVSSNSSGSIHSFN